MPARLTLTPDLILWKRTAAGCYIFSDGLRRVIRQSSGLWLPEIRDTHDSDWRPAGRFASGAAYCCTTLTVAQENALKCSLTTVS
jgi:hypothetical protein